MENKYNLQRFLKAQTDDFETAFAEIKNGRKQSHWMWYIFPQLKGLGRSETAQFYGLENKEEAQIYLNHPVLGNRLIAISEALLYHPQKTAYQIFGSLDDLKLHSCVTLFVRLPNANPVFQKVLIMFFNGKEDEATIKLGG